MFAILISLALIAPEPVNLICEASMRCCTMPNGATCCGHSSGNGKGISGCACQ